MEVEGRKGDTILTGADELYHDEAVRANTSRRASLSFEIWRVCVQPRWPFP
jgi:hypothetical protein